MVKYKQKYEVGDKVVICPAVGRNCTGEVIAINEKYDIPYQVRVDLGEGVVEEFWCAAHKLKSEDILYEDFMNEGIPEIGCVNGVYPKYGLGDAVQTSEDSDGIVYVISETRLIEADDGCTNVMYELTPSYGGGIPPMVVEESTLTFLYHDKSWERALTEGIDIPNGLPEWRGELYNMYSCYANIASHGTLDKSVCRDYEDHTLPPSRMFHVMRSHDIYNRIFDAVGNNLAERRSENREFICKRLNIDDDELTQISGMVMDKLNAMNLEDLSDTNLSKATKKDPGFTEQEKRFIALIDILDISKKKFKDYFPVTLSALQIMQAIKEAYEHAAKAGLLKIQKSKDIDDAEHLDAPCKGKRKYRGKTTSDKFHGMEIEFWYNFDYGFIETAYSIGMNERPEITRCGRKTADGTKKECWKI